MLLWNIPYLYFLLSHSFSKNWPLCVCVCVCVIFVSAIIVTTETPFTHNCSFSNKKMCKAKNRYALLFLSQKWTCIVRKHYSNQRGQKVTYFLHTDEKLNYENSKSKFYFFKSTNWLVTCPGYVFFNLIFLFRRKSKDRRHLLMIPSLSFLSDRIASVSNVVPTTRRVSTI